MLNTILGRFRFVFVQISVFFVDKFQDNSLLCADIIKFFNCSEWNETLSIINQQSIYFVQHFSTNYSEAPSFKLLLI